MLYLTLRGTTCSIGTGQRSLEANVEKADGLGHDHAGSAAVRIAMVLAHAYDRVEIPPTKMVTTRVNLFRAILPSGKTITARRHATRLAVWPRHRHARHLFSRLPDGRIRAPRRNGGVLVRPEDFPRRDHKHPLARGR
jgi:hypothetical protein